MFPPSGASIYRNEDGEVMGWDTGYEPPYLDDDYDQDDAGYDPGPEIDDEGGMSEHHSFLIPDDPGPPPF